MSKAEAPSATSSAPAVNLQVVLILIGIGVLVRAAVLLLVDPSQQGGDSGYYLLMTRGVLEQGLFGDPSTGEPSTYRTPLYPAFMAAVFAVFPSHGALLIAQMVLTIASGLLVLKLFSAEDRLLAILWSFLIVASPFAAFLELRILSETLYSALLLLGWVLLYRADAAPWWRIVLAGILLGLLVLAREVYLLLPLFLLPFALFTQQRLRHLARYAVAAVVAFLVVLPWPLRNAGLPAGEFQLSEGTFGLNLWVGTWERNGDWAETGFPSYAFRSPAEEVAARSAVARKDDDVLRKLAVDRILNDPVGTAATWIARHHRLWVGTRSDLVAMTVATGGLPWTLVKSTLFGLNALLLTAALFGMILCSIKRDKLLFFIIPVIYTAGIYFPFHNSETRYSTAVLPFLYLYAAVAIVAGLRRLDAFPKVLRGISPRHA